jgi:uncharacterized glyoxalase superfamily protein PhnB
MAEATGSIYPALRYYVAIDDVDAHHDLARSEGADIVMAVHDTDYGSREYTARDPEGHLWSFGTYRPEV